MRCGQREQFCNRSDQRFLVYSLGITTGIKTTNDSIIRDIGPGGLSIISTTRIDLGRYYTLRITARNIFATMKCFAIWSILSEIKKVDETTIYPIYMAGMKFADISESTNREIMNLLSNIKRYAASSALDDLNQLGEMHRLVPHGDRLVMPPEVAPCGPTRATRIK